ncbi:PC-Esterase [Macleaya cordata]|uniref:PC-Esterase n=1 Tax=Macleaya cordata TaxID=56857 RepID=A0A200QRN2_MACCD|nr:PC-Esterase [Macleaya cordata]
MVDAEKQLYNGDGGGTLMSDLKSLSSVFKTRRTMVFAYVFMFTFVAFTAFIAFNPSANFSSPWFNNIFSSSSTSDSTASRSQLPSFFSYFFPNSSQPTLQTNPNITRSFNTTSSGNLTVLNSPSSEPKLNQTVIVSPPPPLPSPSSVEKNRVSNSTDYNCSIEFFRSPFLVQEWEMPDTNGTKKETLRLDLVERSSSKYKDADIIVFNTGHWWTHEKTSKGKDYYQVGNHVFGSLNVVEAFHKALMTWAKWVDVNINPTKTLVLFRGYSASHFSGGQWNSGGACDHETEPIKNETYLSAYPPKMRVLESVLGGMNTPVTYLNITRMTDYRKDAHPSVYRKQNLSEEERRSPLRFLDHV